MELHVELSQAVAALASLRSLCEPSAVASWRPSADERASYISKCEQVIAALDRMQLHEARQVFSKGQVQEYVPGPLLRDVREVLVPIESDLWVALGVIDPENQFVREILYSPASWNSGKKLWATFDQGIEEVRNLIDRNAESGFEDTYLPEQAGELLESRLIQFDPDAWRERALSLAPVRVGRVNLILPGNLRLRLEEIYRTYVFGCWMSVISLSRSALEYALLDNASRLGLNSQWPPDRDGKARNKRLGDLIEDYSALIPSIASDLTSLRELGNTYLHPKADKAGRSAIDSRQTDASSALFALGPTIEAIYLHGREA